MCLRAETVKNRKHQWCGGEVVGAWHHPPEFKSWCPQILSTCRWIFNRTLRSGIRRWFLSFRACVRGYIREVWVWCYVCSVAGGWSRASTIPRGVCVTTMRLPFCRAYRTVLRAHYAVSSTDRSRPSRRQPGGTRTWAVVWIAPCIGWSCVRMR